MNGNSESSQHLDPTASPVTLYLPDDIATAIAQLAQQSGKDQTQVLVNALRQGLGLTQSSPHLPALTLEQIGDRLTVLESLPRKIKQLEAKVNRLATVQETARPQLPPPPPPNPRPEPSPATALSQNRLQDHQLDSSFPPHSSAVPLEQQAAASSLENCPNCGQKLGVPLKATGRQVCAKCGWSNKPRLGNSTKDLPVDDLKQLLDQAAVDALTNMKPKGKQNPDQQNSGKGGIRFPLFGR